MKASELFRKAQLSLMLALGSYGLAVFAFGYLGNSFLEYAWTFSAVYLLFAWLGLFLPRKLRFFFGLLGVAVMALPTCFCLEGTVQFTAMVMTVLYGLLLLWSMGMAAWERERELAPEWFMVLLGILIFTYFCATYEPLLQWAIPSLRICVIAFTLLALLSLNRGSWTLAVGGKQNFFLSMRRKNILLTLILFAFAAVVALIPSAVYALQGVTRWIMMLMQALSALFPEETEPSEMPPEMETNDEMQGWLDSMASKGTSETTIMIMWIVAIVVIVPLVISGLYHAGKLLYRLVRKVLLKVTEGIAEEADYTDEVTDTREEREGFREKRSLRKRIAAMGAMTPAEKIRYRYKKLMHKNPQWGHHSTARENLPETAAQVYERVRYSAHPVTQQDAELFKEETE